MTKIHAQEMAAAVMVMPRSRSCSIQSVTVVPFVDLTHFVDGAGIIKNPSVVVVLPASMCAAMPILRFHFLGAGRWELGRHSLALSVTI